MTVPRGYIHGADSVAGARAPSFAQKRHCSSTRGSDIGENVPDTSGRKMAPVADLLARGFKETAQIAVPSRRRKRREGSGPCWWGFRVDAIACGLHGRCLYAPSRGVLEGPPAAASIIRSRSWRGSACDVETGVQYVRRRSSPGATTAPSVAAHRLLGQMGEGSGDDVMLASRPRFSCDCVATSNCTFPWLSKQPTALAPRDHTDIAPWPARRGPSISNRMRNFGFGETR